MAEIDKTLPTTDLPPVIEPDVEIPVADETKLIETENIEATPLPMAVWTLILIHQPI